MPLDHFHRIISRGPQALKDSVLANALLLPTAGTVSVDGVATASPAGTIGARQRVGMVFQNPDASIVSASVEEDVAFALENRALPRHIIAERVDHALDLLDLAEHRQAHPLELSTSDRARLGLAGVVIGDPRYLIMDEATAYLDAADRASLLQAVQELRAVTGMGVVLITHLIMCVPPLDACACARSCFTSGDDHVYTARPKA